MEARPGDGGCPNHRRCISWPSQKWFFPVPPGPSQPSLPTANPEFPEWKGQSYDVIKLYVMEMGGSEPRPITTK
jgi:hypothetical protein